MPWHPEGMAGACFQVEYSQEQWKSFIGGLDISKYESFIENELRELEIYDARRPAGHPYAFPAHVRRVSSHIYQFAKALDFSENAAKTLSQMVLVHDCGKRFQPISIWDTREKPDKMLKDIRREHTIIGANHILATLDEKDAGVQLIASLARFHHEAASGHGYLGLKLDELSFPVRMLILCDSYDGWSVWRPSYGERDISPQGVLDRMIHEKHSDFDRDLLAAFVRMVQKTPETFLVP